METTARINRLANRVDRDGNGMIDANEAGIFCKAALSIKGLSEKGKSATAKFADETIMVDEAVPRATLVNTLADIVENEENKDNILEEIETTFETITLDLPRYERKYTLDVTESKLTSLVQKIDLDGNGVIDKEEMEAFLTGFTTIANIAREDHTVNAKYFPKVLDPVALTAELCKNGPVKCEDFVPALLALQETPSMVNATYLKLLEEAVYSGLDEFKKPTPEKIRARVMKLINAADKNQDGKLDVNEVTCFVNVFCQYMDERGVVENMKPEDEVAYLTKDGSMPLEKLCEMIMDQTDAYGTPYLQELESAIDSAVEALAQ
jgi:Ca2+-binding EF-hand superfamily protein